MNRLYIASACVLLVSEVVKRYFTPKRAAKNIAERAQKIYSTAHEYAPVQPSEFRGHNHRFYNGAQAELETLGFHHLGDFENVTLSRAMNQRRTFLRRLVGEKGTVMSAVYQLKYGVWMRLLALLGRLQRKPYYLDFETEFTDGTFLATSNTGDSKHSSSTPGISQQRHPQPTALRDLLEIDRQKLTDLVSQGLVPLRINNIAEYQASQDRMQALKNRHRKAQGYVDLRQVQAIADAGGNAKVGAQIVAELAALQQQSQSSTSSTPPPLPGTAVSGA